MRGAAHISVAALLLALVAGCSVGESQRHLRTAVDARQDALQGCYASALERDSRAAGEVHAWLYVEDGEGRVERVEIVRSDIQDEGFHACMDQALRDVRLGEPPPANLKVEYAFRFHPVQ